MLQTFDMLCVFTNFYKTWNNPEQTATSRNNKNEQFEFQNLDIFNFKLVLRKQSPCGILKIVFRIPWAKYLKNTFEFIIWQELETSFFQKFWVKFNMAVSRTTIFKNSIFLTKHVNGCLKILLYLSEKNKPWKIKVRLKFQSS